MHIDWIAPDALALAVTVFVALLLLMEALYLLWSARHGRHARRVSERLNALAGDRQRAREALLRQDASQTAELDRLLHPLPGRQALQRWLEQARVPWGLAQLLGASAGLALLAVLLGEALPGLPAWPAALAAGALPWLYVARRRQQRLARLQAQLPEALDLMARALRAGHALSVALQMVGDEMDGPIAAEFRQVHDEVHFGMGLAQAFAKLTERVPLSDVRYFVVAVLIQREAGGNLAELLGKLAALIRERLGLLARVRVLSSEGRLSAWVLVLLPFVLAGLMVVFNPAFIEPLWTDPIGQTLVRWMLALMAVGVLMVRRIIRIRV